MDEAILTELFTIIGAMILIVSAIVAVPIWINKKLSEQSNANAKTRDELFSKISKSNSQHGRSEGRIGILEVQQEASNKRMEEIGHEVGTIRETLVEMKLKNQENHLIVLQAINNRRRVHNEKDNNE